MRAPRAPVDVTLTAAVLDTEGLTAGGNTEEYDMKVVALAYMISSTLFYNAMSKVCWEHRTPSIKSVQKTPVASFKS